MVNTLVSSSCSPAGLDDENFLEEEGRHRLAPSSTGIVAGLAQRVNVWLFVFRFLCFGYC